MFEATISEFPFVGELPKRDKSKLQEVWDELAEFHEVSKREHGLVSVQHAMKCLNVSRSSIDDLVRRCKLTRFEFGGHVVISVKSLKQWANAERSVGGRPRNKK